jgi:2-dehydro-3-deoxygluconokinase
MPVPNALNGSSAGAERTPVDLVAVGETMVMVTPVDAVPLDQAHHLVARVGGAESNVAMYLAGLGHRAIWTSRVGDDPFGRIVLRHVAAAGVDVSSVVIDSGAPTGVYFKDPRSEGTLVYYYRSGSAASRLEASVLDQPALAGARILHLSGITPALSAGCLALVRHAVVGRALGTAQVSFDVNYRPALWSDDPGPVLRELANAADLVFVGLDEAQSLWGVTDATAVRRLLPDPDVVVVKDGPIGATALTRGGNTVFVPAPRVRVVEPVGAGDAFAAGYLSADLHGRDLRARLRMGHLVAAHALTVMSDHAPLPDQGWFDERVTADVDLWSGLEFPIVDSLRG